MAANGYRASVIPERGDLPGGSKWKGNGGNVIDYQAIAWLLKQPAPRYLVTDAGFTGPWMSHASRLWHEVVTRKLVTSVRTLVEVQKLLEDKKRKK